MLILSSVIKTTKVQIYQIKRLGQKCQIIQYCTFTKNYGTKFYIVKLKINGTAFLGLHPKD